MNILDQIIAHKQTEVADRKKVATVRQLEKSKLFSSPAFSLKEFVCASDKTGIIAEFKRKSPSKGVINASASLKDTTVGYVRAGASALSVLTDQRFFGGSNDDLIGARGFNACPILRKDFTIDEYQILEAKSIGADAILLIAAVLDPLESKKMADLAHSLGLEVLMEVHDENELLNNLEVGADLIGVNNRNLKTFQVSVEVSEKLAPLIPETVVKVSESGISSPETIIRLKRFGYKGFLVGESFMKENKPEMAAMDFMARLGRLEEANK
jgi:indole-3-glycerol phosphate synthase